MVQIIKSIMMAGILSSIRRTGIRSVATAFNSPNAVVVVASSRSATMQNHQVLFMSATADTTSTTIVPRVKAADASTPSDGPVVIKGWVRTVRKQKTLAFVEVNDGSNLGGIQCVLSIDDETMEGTYCMCVCVDGSMYIYNRLNTLRR
jgi:hypothetical protein